MTATFGTFTDRVMAAMEAQDRGEYRGSPIRRTSFSGRAFLDRTTIRVADFAAAAGDCWLRISS